MPYNVYFSDPNKLATPIVVQDANGTSPGNESDTSITLIGKNASNYSAYIATDLVQMLENFASASPPNNPIQGQLWFNNADNRLYINDGTAGTGNWQPSSGIYRKSGSTNKPTGLPGDLLVDEDAGQLFLTIDGTNWTLVGPNYSSTLKTGVYPETVVDKFGAGHQVIKQYINDNVIEIISQDSFVPQAVIDGFSTIQPGLNLNSNFGGKLNATSYAAENILVTSPYTEYVLGNNFVRNDIDNTISANLNVRTLGIGTVPTFVLSKSNTQNNFINSSNGGSFAFSIADPSGNGNSPTLLKIDGGSVVPLITIGGDKTTDVSISGSVRIAGTLTVALNTFSNASFKITGPAEFDNAVLVAGTSIFTTSTTFSNIINVGKTGQPTNNLGVDAIIPLSSATYNIGQPLNPFSNIYSKNFVGAFQGNLTGNASGLSNSSTWQLANQLSGGLYYKGGTTSTSYQGQAGTFQFNASLNVNAINQQTTATTVLVTDSILAATNSATTLVQISKANFLYELYNSLVPAGTILPWAGVDYQSIQMGAIPVSVGSTTVKGISNKKSDGTYNWLVCDGSFFYVKDYPSLFAAIGYTYGGDPSVAAFAIPDMRGRMAIGYDNMTNGFLGSPSSAANRVPGANKPDAVLATQGLAPLVTGGSNTATLTSNVAGPDGVSTSTSTQITGVMNPYFAFNYIIKT